MNITNDGLTQTITVENETELYECISSLKPFQETGIEAYTIHFGTSVFKFSGCAPGSYGGHWENVVKEAKKLTKKPSEPKTRTWKHIDITAPERKKPVFNGDYVDMYFSSWHDQNTIRFMIGNQSFATVRKYHKFITRENYRETWELTRKGHTVVLYSEKDVFDLVKADFKKTSGREITIRNGVTGAILA